MMIACQAVSQLTTSLTPEHDQAADDAMTQVAEYLHIAPTLTALAAQTPILTILPPTTSTLEPTSQPLENQNEVEDNSTQALVAKLPTATDIPPEVATASACQYSAFLDYETIPPCKEIPLNHKFTKMWRIRNTSNCSWMGDFELTCVSNCNLFGVSGSIPITNRIINPKEQIEIHIDLKGPKDKSLINKKTTATWMIRGGGKIFGVEPDGKTPLSVCIKTVD